MDAVTVPLSDLPPIRPPPSTPERGDRDRVGGRLGVGEGVGGGLAVPQSPTLPLCTVILEVVRNVGRHTKNNPDRGDAFALLLS